VTKYIVEEELIKEVKEIRARHEEEKKRTVVDEEYKKAVYKNPS
jgi:hypothetical protein